MIAARETIYAALFALASGMPELVTKSRRRKDVTGLSSNQMPAVYQHQLRERVVKVQRGMPSIWELDVDFYIYLSNGDPNVVPSSILNPILDSLTAMLQPGMPENEQTLGGLVAWCRIYDEIEIHEGTDGEQIIVLVPVRILTT